MHKRLLIILPTLAAGGTTRIVMSVSRRLMAAGWSITLTTLFPRPDAPLSPVEPGMAFEPLVPFGRRRQVKALLGLTRLAREHDVVLAAQEIAATNYGWLACTLAQRPFISWTHVAYARLAPLLPPVTTRLPAMYIGERNALCFRARARLNPLPMRCNADARRTGG